MFNSFAKHAIRNNWAVAIDLFGRVTATQGSLHRCLTALPDVLLNDIQDVVGTRVSTNATILAAHGTDESYHPVFPPQLVVYPTTTQEVQKIVSSCSAQRTPIIPFGVGTSLEGHIAAVKGGVCLDMSRMNKILHVSAEDLVCWVEPGVTRKQLNDHLRSEGLFFPVDPGADATLGGMAATRASGTTAVRYGTMRDVVLGMKVVTAGGDVLHTGRPVKKSSAGYDLTAIMVGSEGTLGVITEVMLRVFPLPQAVSAAVCVFPHMKAAVDGVTTTMQCGIDVARIELLDELQISAINAYSQTSLTPAPTVFFEFHGTDAGVKEQAKDVKEIVSDFGASDFEWATTPEDRSRLWDARHTAYWAARASQPGKQGFPTDVCVPLSKLSDSILYSQQLCKDARIYAPLVGHVGDGNFHMLLMVDPQDAEEMERAQKVVHEMVQMALRNGGTCTGEHGIGYGKLKYLSAEWGAAALDMMHAIKMALDPLNIMNPGKLGSHPDTFVK